MLLYFTANQSSCCPAEGNTSSQCHWASQASRLPNLFLSHLSFLYRQNQRLPPPDCQKLNSSHVNVLKQSISHTRCIQHVWQRDSVESVAYTGHRTSLCTQLTCWQNTPTLHNSFRSTDGLKQSCKSFTNIPLRIWNTISRPPPFPSHEEVNMISELNRQDACRFPETIRSRTTAVHRNQFSGAAGKAGNICGKPKMFLKQVFFY